MFNQQELALLDKIRDTLSLDSVGDVVALATRAMLDEVTITDTGGAWVVYDELARFSERQRHHVEF